MFDFEIDPDYQKKLDWAKAFVAEEIEPLDYVFPHPYDRSDAAAMKAARPLMERVQAEGLWACHLPPAVGGGGFGQVKLALLNEILGHSPWAPIIFGCQAPDSGNAEILAHFGTDEQKAQYLAPLLAAEVVSCFAMTEPHAGADPRLFTTRAQRNGDGWHLNGEKWFASHARWAEFLIVMAVTDPTVSIHRGASMFIVPTDTPGVEIVRNVGLYGHSDADASHAYLRFEDVALPAESLLGPEGGAFTVAQIRLGGGRIHHAMRTLGQARRAFDMMCERVVSRSLTSGRLADLSSTKERIAQSWIELEQFRLLVLRTAWLIDKHNDYKMVRADIAAVKAAMPGLLRGIAQRAVHLHGSLGVTTETPLAEYLIFAEVLGLADGPTEVHEATLADYVLKNYSPAPDVFPSDHGPRRTAQAEQKLGVSAVGH